MQSYLAHYKSPQASDARGMGYFEFQSNARLGTKANRQDARLKMLELYGKDAVSWEVDSVERKRKANASLDGQMELDFRPGKTKRGKTKQKQGW